MPEPLHTRSCNSQEGCPAFTPEQVQAYISEVPDWFSDDDTTTIARTFHFNDFQDAIVFVNKVAGLAEKQRHHPNIFVHNFSKVTVSLTTRSIGGLSDNDFVMAAKIDNIL